MSITKADVPRLSAAIRTAGELWEVHGEMVLDLTADWATGARSANLDPDSGGNRWESCDDPTCSECPHAIPADPTGEAVLNARADKASELQKRLARILEDSLWLRDMAFVIAPIVPASVVNAKSEVWCSHHLKVGLCEPRKNGSERNTLCRWCSDIFAEWKALPPLQLVKDRHNKEKCNDKMLKAAFKREGMILQDVGEITKVVKANRGATGRPNQNQKAKAS